MPLAALLLALAALPLGIQSPRAQRSWGASLSILLGLLIFIVYYAILSVGIALAESNSFPIPAALWLPNLIILLIAVYGLQRICSERWQSIAGALEGVLAHLKKPLI